MLILNFEDIPIAQPKQASNAPYIIAVVLMSLIGVIAILALTALRPEKDNSLLITNIIGFLAPTTLSLLAFMKCQETHLSVNGQLATFVSAAKQVAHSAGKDEGRVEGIAEGELRHPATSQSETVSESQADHIKRIGDDTNKRVQKVQQSVSEQAPETGPKGSAS